MSGWCEPHWWTEHPASLVGMVVGSFAVSFVCWVRPPSCANPTWMSTPVLACLHPHLRYEALSSVPAVLMLQPPALLFTWHWLIGQMDSVLLPTSEHFQKLFIIPEEPLLLGQYYVNLANAVLTEVSMAEQSFNRNKKENIQPSRSFKKQYESHTPSFLRWRLGFGKR